MSYSRLRCGTALASFHVWQRLGEGPRALRLALLSSGFMDLLERFMRVLIVALALVATPFVAGVSQGLGHDAAHCARRAEQHPGKDINKCDPAPNPSPAPGPSCAALSGSTGT